MSGEYGLNHFVLPKVLISIEGDRTFITYTTERQDFNIETFKEVVSYFENTEVNETEDSLGDVTRGRHLQRRLAELVEEAMKQLMKLKIVLARRRLIKI